MQHDQPGVRGGGRQINFDKLYYNYMWLGRNYLRIINLARRLLHVMVIGKR